MLLLTPWTILLSWPIRASKSGKPMYTRFVIRRSAASSKSKGLFVAPITKIRPREDPTPSNYTKNSVFTRRAASFSLLLRAVSIESISSIKMIEGE